MGGGARAARRCGPGQMKVAVVNATGDPRITRRVLDPIVGALARQAGEHYAPFWQSSPVGIYLADSLAQLREPDTSVMLVLRDPDQAGVLGYHGRTLEGRPLLRVFSRPIL